MKDNKLNRFNIAVKIFEGELLSFDEFVIACKADFYNVNPVDYNSAYNSLKASFYKSPKQHGYLCNKHVQTRIDENHVCGYGLHISEIDTAYLTPENKRYLTEKILKGVK